jgi:hypothetical protein
MDIEQYHLISEMTEGDLNREVGNAMKSGWQPWNSPGIAHSGTQRFFIQAMVKYVKKQQYMQPSRN